MSPRWRSTASGASTCLVVNLYPFEDALKRGADYAEMIENIDIGGPAMIRAAAKNHGFVNVVVDVEDYGVLLEELDQNDGQTSYPFRQWLAQNAYARTAAYDAAVSNWMAGAIGLEAPRRRAVAGQLAQTLRYGENPHQEAAFYTDGTGRSGVATATQVQGKELSYNNINDTDAAFELVSEFPAADGPAVAIIKHANPCGVARGATLLDAYQKAFDCDRTSAFGGIVALNQPLDAGNRDRRSPRSSPRWSSLPVRSDAAKEIFAAKKNLRLLLTDALPNPQDVGLTTRQVSGGMLVQDKDVGHRAMDDLKVVTEKAPTEEQMQDLLFAWKVAKHVKSNAIVYVKAGARPWASAQAR